MARQNVILDVLREEELKYHTQDEIGRLMNQLSVTYAGKARTYPIGETNGRSVLYVIELSDSLENSHLKPAIKVRNLPTIYQERGLTQSEASRLDSEKIAHMLRSMNMYWKQ